MFMCIIKSPRLLDHLSFQTLYSPSVGCPIFSPLLNSWHFPICPLEFSHRPLFYPQPPPWTLPSPLDLTETWLSPEDSRSPLYVFVFPPYSLLPLGLEVGQVSPLLLLLSDPSPFVLHKSSTFEFHAKRSYITHHHLTVADIYQTLYISFPLFFQNLSSWLTRCNATTLLLFLQFQYTPHRWVWLTHTYLYFFSFSHGSFPPAYR